VRHPKCFFADDDNSAEEPANKKVKVEAASGALFYIDIYAISDRYDFFQEEVISSCMPRRHVCWTRFGFSSSLLECL
jgi:hypothetical protein